MAEFTVSEVIDGDTFKVKGSWKWNQRIGDAVCPTVIAGNLIGSGLEM